MISSIDFRRMNALSKNISRGRYHQQNTVGINCKRSSPPPNRKKCRNSWRLKERTTSRGLYNILPGKGQSPTHTSFQECLM